MPQPRPSGPRPSAAPIAAAVAAQGLRLDQVDPDTLFFLQNVHPDGNSYVLDLPARGKSPPATVRYESPATPAANGEARSALAPSPDQPGSGHRVVVEKKIPPAAADVLPWYETRPMDEDYRNFWRQARIVGGTLLVLQVGQDMVLRYGLDAAPVRLADIADWADKDGWAQIKGGEEVPAVAALTEDGDGDGAGVGEKKKLASIRKDGPALESRVPDSPGRSIQKEVKQGLEKKRKGEGGAGTGKIKAVKRGEEMMYELPVETLNAVDTKMNHSNKPHSASKAGQGQEEKGEGKRGAGKIEVLKRKEEMLNELPVETLNTVNKETNSSNGHDAKPHSASRFLGVVWPIHIMERPESSFKKNLLRVLRKPFNMVEYEEKHGDATINRPATKIRQTRRGVKYYNSEHERNQSYFDSYPDLAKQVKSTSYSNKLALLRGFYFWLQNVTDEDQFRPWSDDFRQYTIIPLE